MTRSPNVRANAIRLRRQEHGGSFLVVEGRDDRLFFEQFVDRRCCWVIVADGKRNVVDVVGILEADGFPRCDVASIDKRLALVGNVLQGRARGPAPALEPVAAE